MEVKKYGIADDQAIEIHKKLILSGLNEFQAGQLVQNMSIMKQNDVIIHCLEKMEKALNEIIRNL